jgi:hypothetical protein
MRYSRMRSTPKPTLIVTVMFLCICCAQFAEAQRRPEGKLDIVFRHYKEEVSVIKDPGGCCPRKACCLQHVFKEVIKSINSKSIGDMGILVKLTKDSTAFVEEISLEIYSVKGKLVFSTKTQSLSSRTIRKPMGYLLALDNTAASIAQQHFIEENKIVVTLKTRGDRGVPNMVDLVNVNKGNQ